MNKLKEWDKKVNQAWARVGRGKKTLLYLTLCVLLSLGIWVRLGCPLPAAEQEFRRLERTHLLPRSEIVYSSERDDPIQWGDMPAVSRQHGLVIGLWDEGVHVYEPDTGLFQSHRVEEGIAAVPLYDNSISWKHPVLEDETLPRYFSGTGVLFLRVPEETSRAELEISGLGRYWEELHKQEEGRRLAPGLWLFTAEITDPEDPYRRFEGWCVGGSYILKLYRADDSLLLEHSGTLGE